MQRKQSSEDEKDDEEEDEIERERSKGKTTEKESKPSADTNISKVKLTDIIMKQKISGFWEAKSPIAKILRIDFDNLIKTVPEDIKLLQENENIWMTIIVVVWIETNFMGSKSSWELIKNKAVSWLGKQKVELAAQYDSARKFLESASY